MGSAGVPVASAAVPPPSQLPRQRGAASVPPPPGPRASAPVHPGDPYGRSEPEDLGASTGYAQAPGVYGSPASGNTYGAPAGTYGRDFDSDEYNGYGAPTYGADQGDYNYDHDAPQTREPGNVTGDPNYKARRHRPSANDTNVGSLSDFASYGGYPSEQNYGRN